MLDRGSTLGYYGNPFAHFIHSKTVEYEVRLGAREVVSQVSEIWNLFFSFSFFLLFPLSNIPTCFVWVERSRVIIVLWQLTLLQDQLVHVIYLHICYRESRWVLYRHKTISGEVSRLGNGLHTLLFSTSNTPHALNSNS